MLTEHLCVYIEQVRFYLRKLVNKSSNRNRTGTKYNIRDITTELNLNEWFECLIII